MKIRSKYSLGLTLLVALGLGCGDDGPGVDTPNPNNDQSSTNNGSNNSNNASTSMPDPNCVISKAGVEVCDRIDNDCDGQTDEGFELGEVCTAGVGACQAEGVTVCGDDEVSVACIAQEGTPETETCDDIDNDCDGEVDEDFNLGESCSAGEGACLNEGSIVCQEDGTAACSAVAGDEGATETCNGSDDDCNGEVDEGFDIGGQCTVGTGLCVATGVLACAEDGTSGCSVSPGQPPEAVEMTCDGLDNDCDGEVDEGCDDDEDNYCDESMTVVGSPAVCILGGGDCNDMNASINPGASEVCDNLDNNCSGSVDVDAIDGTVYYLDCDGDNFASGTIGRFCSPPSDATARTQCSNASEATWQTTNGNDCQDTDPDAYPGQTAYFEVAMNPAPSPTRTHDYNCNGTNDRLNTDVASSNFVCRSSFFPGSGCGTGPAGWRGSIPACGTSGTYDFCVNMTYNSLLDRCEGTASSASQTQRCR